VALLECLWSWRESEIEQEKLEPKEPEPLLKPGDSRKTIEKLDHYLLNKKGVNGTPLAYLVRDHVVPTEDLGFGQPTITDGLITRAHHAGYSDYEVDNNYLWGIIRTLTQKGFAWCWVQDQTKSLNGRVVYMQLKLHYLGPSIRGKIKSDADKILETAYLYGKARNFTLEDYCGKLKRAFADLDDCQETVPEARKVRVFMQGLRSPELQVARSQVIQHQCGRCHELCQVLREQPRLYEDHYQECVVL
jgi:hypothetical protein